jgi:uncharacterized protein (TIGR03067 family)
MLLSKLKITLVLCAVIGVVGTGLGGVSFRAVANHHPAVQSGPQQAAQGGVKQAEKQGNAAQASAAKKFAELEGTWTIVKMEIEGKSLLEKDEKWQLVVKDGRLTFNGQGGHQEALDLSRFVDPSKKPKAVTYPYEGKLVFYGIYEVKGDELYVCGDGVDTAQEKNPEGRRPKEFKSSEGLLLVFKRTKAEQPRKSPDQKPADRDQAQQALAMILKGFQAYQDSKGGGRKTERPDQAAVDLYAEAFLKAFQVSREIAKAKAKGQAKIRPEDEAVFDACGPAFVQAYERARILKKTLEEQKASGGKGSEKAIEALGVFLKAGKEFEQAVKLRAKAQAVEQARKEIESALSRVKKTAHDQRTELEALEEIEKAVRDMKQKVQQGKDGK